MIREKLRKVSARVFAFAGLIERRDRSRWGQTMRIQPLKSYLSGMLTLIFLGSGTIANAVLITHTGTHAGASTTTQIDFFSQGTNQFDSDESSVDGIPKFNPALGTLNRVIVSSTLEYEFEFEFFATSTDEFDPFRRILCRPWRRRTLEFRPLPPPACSCSSLQNRRHFPVTVATVSDQ